MPVNRNRKAVTKVCRILNGIEEQLVWKMGRWQGKGSIMNNGVLVFKREVPMRKRDYHRLNKARRIIREKFVLADLISLDDQLEIGLSFVIDDRLSEIRAAGL
ncbi:hypothetical protein [Natroniella sp. ANB-PHB2]|uniref:hypothetical protein n=1 Tax=Natroniella sp. ANB-PHB2 TaxID=3384444 RepID=UPI0038D46307